MAYDPNIPLATDVVRQSQPELRENFTQIQNVFQVNHSLFNSLNAGRHTGVVFVDQAGDVTTDVDEFGLYTKQSPRTGVPELFTRRASNGTVYGITEADTTLNGGLNGYAMTSSGLLLQWGQATVPAAGAQTFNINIPYPVICLGAWFTIKTPGVMDANTFVQLVTLPVSPALAVTVFGGQRTAVNVQAAVEFYWTTIGF